MTHTHCLLPLALLALAVNVATYPATAAEPPRLAISGIYPHLAMYNTPEGEPPDRGHGECGVGALAVWADRLWCITYPPHQRRGSRDKLYEIDADLHQVIRPESVGGTHANRLLHAASEQLIIGPYFIDRQRNVRALDLKRYDGRMTATATHLTDPENLVYFIDMEGTIYEVNVHTLEARRLFDKPVPGWHAKGAYTGQGRLVVTNNGEHPSGERSYATLQVGGPAQTDDEAGVLAEWDGDAWRIVERKQFTDVAGPGGIAGADDPQAPLWSMGWDRRSVILKLCDGGQWSTFRLPKASHAFDPRHGWFTEWPRIRAAAPGQWLMVMHGQMFDFPASFSAANTAGLRPRCTHLRYIPDYCDWNGRLVLGADDASFMQNPLVGQAQSNLWFGDLDHLRRFGPPSGWGGVWLGDRVAAGDESDPILIAGYQRRVLHLAHNHGAPVRFTLLVDPDGRGHWRRHGEVVANGYTPVVLPDDLAGEWLKLRIDTACLATAYLHFASPRASEPGEAEIFAGLADVGEAVNYTGGWVRPAGHNRSLQWVVQAVDGAGQPSAERYVEVELNAAGDGFDFRTPADDRSEELRRHAPPAPFSVDAASVIVTDPRGARWRLPRGPAHFDQPLATGWPRGVREAVSERFLANLHGLFYEIPRAGGHEPDFRRLKPVCSHSKAIGDFCTWRGLLVLTGARRGAGGDGQTFTDADGHGLWFGHIDDLWRLGKPRGVGGPWSDTPVAAGAASDPYLMTGFDRKRLELTHDLAAPATFLVEIDFDHRLWRHYARLTVPPGETLVHEFPAGYSAHWLRITAEQACRATAQLTYE